MLGTKKPRIRSDADAAQSNKRMIVLKTDTTIKTTNMDVQHHDVQQHTISPHTAAAPRNRLKTACSNQIINKTSHHRSPFLGVTLSIIHELLELFLFDCSSIPWIMQL